MKTARLAAEAQKSASAAKPTSATPKAVVAKKSSQPATITVSAVGDMLFDRKVKAVIESKGGQAPLADVATTLADADVTIGNLESVLATSGVANPDKSLTLQGDPRAAEALSAAGFDLLAVANDHAMDFGPDALQQSLDTLNAAGIAHAGAGVTQAEAWQPATYASPNATVAFLSFNHMGPDSYTAGPDTPGVASGRSDLSLIKSAVRTAGKTSDYVIVYIHSGGESVDEVTDAQKQAARAAIDAGADMVLMSGPHVIQGVEFYKKGLIAYSLGTMVFDHVSKKAGETFVLDAELGPNGVASVRAKPAYVDANGTPRFVTGVQADSILGRLKDLSSPFNTQVDLADGVGILQP